MSGAYYNEIDEFAAQWLRNLIAAGHIAPGDVDTRSVDEVAPDDLKGYTQCHFFAGIGVWSHALRSAGWPDDRPVWTGSCPCRPFSSAGKRKGTADERHLWPAWHWLVEHCQPPELFGEQVASKDGLGWLDLVQADLEGTGYTSFATDLCAASVGAPHIRQRLWFYAQRLDNSTSARRSAQGPVSEIETWNETWLRGSERGRGDVGMADPHGTYRRSGDHRKTVDDRESGQRFESSDRVGECGDVGNMGSTLGNAFEPLPTNGFWRDADWLFCRDGKWRPVRPGSFPLVDGSAGRVGRLRAYGNAIVPQVAQTFIEAVLDIGRKDAFLEWQFEDDG